jgi:hypothetical protein
MGEAPFVRNRLMDDTTKGRGFAADLLQVQRSVIINASFVCSVWRVGAPLGAPDRMDPPGAI